jgi:hypothetical protein
MFWSGLAVVLIVPAAFIMICVAVLLERSGIMHAVRTPLRSAIKLLRTILGRNQERDDVKF